MKTSHVGDLVRDEVYDRKVHSLTCMSQCWNRLADFAQVAKVTAPGVAEALENLLELGLRTPAIDLHARCAESLRTSRHIREVMERVNGLPSDVLSLDTLEATLHGNLRALADRRSGLLDNVKAWKASRQNEVWVRAFDGNIVRHTLRDNGVGDWGPWVDARAAAKLWAQQHGANLGLAPITIEGMSPPWMFVEICRATSQRADGSWPRITVVQEDPLELLDGLAHIGLEEWLSQARVEIVAGPSAGACLGERLRARSDYEINGPVIVVESTKARVRPSVREVITRSVVHQRDEEASLRRALDRTYAGRDVGWWSRRYAAAASGGEPLRVLVPTCRYSTFIQHSSRGLAAAFERAGCRAEVLIEPDDCTRFTSGAYLRRIAEFEPDLIVLINFARSHLPGKLPKDVPYVCWIQDAMPHLFDERSGASHGSLDFLAGHLHGELFTRFGYPAERLIPSPVVADDARFHTGAVDPAVLREHTCEIAMASHHGETPEAMHERLMRECAPEPLLGETCRRLRPRIERAVQLGLDGSILATIGAAVREEVESVYGRNATSRVESIVRRVYAVPLADRMIRHETLHWAADLAASHGWRLHVYGRGWDVHPRFGRYWRGELGHGEPLRAAYQGARVHLHASVNTLVHQRVMECALSGGLPLCRLHGDALASVRAWAQQAAIVRGGNVDSAGGAVVIDAEQHPEVGTALEALASVGDDSRGWLIVPRGRVESMQRERAWKSLGHHAAWLLGDLCWLTFTSKDSLEACVGRAIEDSAWRAASSEAIAERVRAELSLSALAKRMLTCVGDSLRGVEHGGDNAAIAA